MSQYGSSPESVSHDDPVMDGWRVWRVCWEKSFLYILSFLFLELFLLFELSILSIDLSFPLLIGGFEAGGFGLATLHDGGFNLALVEMPKCSAKLIF